MKIAFLNCIPHAALFLILVCAFGTSRAQIVTTIAGDGTNTFSGDGGPAVAAAIGTTVEVTTDRRGNVYFADIFNHRIRKINTAGIVSTFAGNGVAGCSGDGGLATAAQINETWNMCTDDTGNLYFTDAIRYIVRKVSVSGIITTFAGNGAGMFNGDGGPATAASFTYPSGLACDRYGNVYCCDARVNCIRKIDTSGIINTIAGMPFVAGGFSGDGGPATSANMYRPVSLTADSAGNLYFFDGANNRVRKISTTGIITTIAGNGAASYSGDGGPATSAAIGTVEAIAAHPDGRVYLMGYNGKIRIVSPAGVITHYSGKGGLNFGGDGLSATDTNVAYNLPCGMAFDTASTLFIADRGNYRLRRIGSSTTSVATISNQQSFFAGIYPNPSGKMLHVCTRGTENNVVEFSVTDLNGRLRYHFTLNERGTDDLQTDLEPGIYIAVFTKRGEMRKQILNILP